MAIGRHTRTAVLIVLTCMAIASCIGCARFSVPAPSDPVQPIALPAVEDSVVLLPLKLETGGADINSLLESMPGSLGGRVRRFLNRQASKLDENLLQQESVQRTAAMAWQAMEHPLKLKDDFYLLLNPRELRLSIPSQQRRGSDGTIAALELVARPMLVTSVPTEVTSSTTPSITISPEARDAGFHVAVEAEVTFARISHDLSERQKNKVYTFAGGTVHVVGIHMYASGTSVILEITVEGDTQGTLYLSGVPHYDPGKRMLTVEGFDYTLATKDVLARSADWLLHTDLREKMEAQAQWPLGERIDGARELLTKALNRDINEHLSLKGDVARIEPVAVGVTSTSVKAVFQADGTIELRAR